MARGIGLNKKNRFSRYLTRSSRSFAPGIAYFRGITCAPPAGVIETLRLCKATLVGTLSLFFFIVALDNLTDYNSNFQFVRHVLSMDDTFPGNKELWRALPYPILFHIFYLGIIATEATSAALTGYAAYRLARGAFGSPLTFWMTAFLTIGGEWFLMWQSKSWNGQEAASRMFGVEALILIFLWQEEKEPPHLHPGGLS